MQSLKIRGGKPLRGKVNISGAKNSAVTLIPAAILADWTVSLEQLPEIRDVEIYRELLRDLGADVKLEEAVIHINPTRMKNSPVSSEKVQQLRASYYLMGALLGKFKKAQVGLPGGCNLGPRPIDQHIKGFEALGAKVTQDNGMISLEAERLIGTRIYLDVVSVGATINIMLAASRAEGTTHIENAAKEPEIIDVATLLNSMGAEIKGAGTDVIRITGMPHLKGCRHAIIPDRIEAGTFMIAAAATRGQVRIDQVIPKHLEPVTAKLREIGVIVEEGDDYLDIRGNHTYKEIKIKTLPYPGFPTDLQQPVTSLLTGVSGTSVVTDNIYQARFRHIDELKRMGASLKVEGSSVLIQGMTELQGAKVNATDLRAGAALVVAGLMADGVTEVTGIEHIDRGYENLETKLRDLGADIWRDEQDSWNKER